MSKKFLLILVDQMRYDCIECLNKQPVMSPHLNDLCIDSNVYNNAFTPSPSCVPARACIATGNEPFKNKKVGYVDKSEWNYSSFMHALSQKGVLTINVGKTHFYPQNNKLGFKINKIYDPQNFHDGFVSDYNKWLARENKSRCTDIANIQSNNSYVYFPFTEHERFHPTNWTADEAIRQLEKLDKNKDFFMQVSFHRPHAPLDPPREYYNMYNDLDIERFELGNWEDEMNVGVYSTDCMKGKLTNIYNLQMIKAYFGAITHVDYNIGKILKFLKDNNMYEDIQIIFTSDHGEMLGEHNMFRKVVPFNGSAKIPLIYKNNKSTNKNSNICSLIDLAPTILDYFEIRDFISDGVVLNSSKHQKRKYIFGEHTYVDDGWFYVVSNHYKYIWNSMTGEEYMFDILEDEKEMYNIIKDIDASEYKSYLTDKLLEQYGDIFVKDNQLKSGMKVNPFGKI